MLTVYLVLEDFQSYAEANIRLYPYVLSLLQRGPVCQEEQICSTTEIHHPAGES